MGLPAFDILKFVDELKDSGMPEKQAKLVAEGFNQIQQLRPVTIEDVRHEIQVLEQRIEERFKAQEEKFDIKLAALQNSLIIKLGAVIIGSVTVLGFVLKLVH